LESSISNSEDSGFSSDSADSSSSSSDSGALRKKLQKKLRDGSELVEMKNMKKAMAGIKIKAPFVWDGKPEPLDLRNRGLQSNFSSALFM
jgi:hypothetical protein